MRRRARLSAGALVTIATVGDDRPLDAEYAAYAAEHLRDLIDRHAPDLLWNDIDWPDAGKDFSEFGLGRVFEEYYAAVPEGVVNDRWHVPHHDYAMRSRLEPRASSVY